MPAFYAHYKFGHMVQKALPEDLQQQIQAWQELYDIGLHGPDILFFYHPLRRHEIGRIGVKIHHTQGRAFFERAVRRIRQSDNQEAMMVYGMGVVCHLALDAACHPFIAAYEEQSGISHHEIEKELEKYLMNRDGIDPFSFDCREYMESKLKWARVIAGFYGLRPVQIEQAMEGFLFFSRLFYTKSRLKRAAIFSGMRLTGTYHEVRGFFANQKDNEKCLAGSRHMEKQMRDNVQVAAAMIEELDGHWQADETLSAWFDRPFSV